MDRVRTNAEIVLDQLKGHDEARASLGAARPADLVKVGARPYRMDNGAQVDLYPDGLPTDLKDSIIVLMGRISAVAPGMLNDDGEPLDFFAISKNDLVTPHLDGFTVDEVASATPEQLSDMQRIAGYVVAMRGIYETWNAIHKRVASDVYGEEYRPDRGLYWYPEEARVESDEDEAPESPIVKKARENRELAFYKAVTLETPMAADEATAMLAAYHDVDAERIYRFWRKLKDFDGTVTFDYSGHSRSRVAMVGKDASGKEVWSAHLNDINGNPKTRIG